MSERKACLIIGAGQGVGASVARAFAAEGMTVCLTRRPRNLDSLQRVHLTSRQVQVLGLICQGHTNKQIADALQIIEATAKAHVSAIFKELGVVSRTQALLAAQRLGFKEQQG
jgi:DNA-binding NarL/FixJ family response regulator